MHFPTWRYHRTESPRLVRDLEELDALGDGWADTPAAFECAEEAAPEPELEPAIASGPAGLIAKPKRGKKGN